MPYPFIESTSSTGPQNNLAKSGGLGASSQMPFIHYQKNNLIGKGTFGKVYTALNLQTGGLLAVKSITLSTKTDPKKRQHELDTIENEINLLKDLEHPNIVKYHYF